MKTITTILVLGLLTSVTSADPNEDEQRFLTVPGAERSFRGTDEAKFTRAELPKQVLSILGGFDWGIGEPISFVGYALDLNKDGKNEYFIETIRGGSGGPAFVVVAEINRNWKTILDFQGGFHVIPVPKKWPRLVAISRGGGGTFCKRHFEFDGGAYVETLRENYDRGTITKTTPAKSKG